MLESITQYVDARRAEMPDLNIGLAFVDVQTNQLVHLDGDAAHYSLSTFKGPLGAYYLWLLERGEIEALPADEEHLIPMLNWSSNPDTTCIFKRVGGLNPFNDWLVDQGFTRAKNFVFRWQSWGCKEGNDYYLPDSDWRYANGDESLGLPGGYVLMRCAEGLTCDKVFAPAELAMFYARVYRGEVLNADSTARWLGWMVKTREGSALHANLPDDPQIRVYAKNGFRAVDAFYDQNFFNEAGIIETERGAFVVAVFMRGNPNYPGTDVISEIARIAFDYFAATFGE